MPKLKVHSCKLSKLPSSTYRKMNSLNFRGGGTMQETLRYNRSLPNTTAVVYWVEERGGKLLSWALEYDMRPEVPTEPRTVNIYTRTTYRNRGYGKLLLTKIVSLGNPFKVYYHDFESDKLWSSVHSLLITKLRA